MAVEDPVPITIAVRTDFSEWDNNLLGEDDPIINISTFNNDVSIEVSEAGLPGSTYFISSMLERGAHPFSFSRLSENIFITSRIIPKARAQPFSPMPQEIPEGRKTELMQKSCARVMTWYGKSWKGSGLQ